MGGFTENEWRGALYRQLARQPGLPPGLRPELIKRAEACDRSPVPTPRADIEGCKGAVGR